MMQRIRVTNGRAAFMTLWLEPWGNDYGMAPGDEFEVVAADAADNFYFHLVDEGSGLKLYAEGSVTQLAIYHGGEEILCGHNRREDTW